MTSDFNIDQWYHIQLGWISNDEEWENINVPLSTINAKHEKTEENGNTNQGNCGWCSEELTVVNAVVPDYSKHDDKNWDHQITHIKGGLVLLHHRRNSRAWGGWSLWNVTMDDTVICDVEWSKSAGLILQKLALVNELHLLLSSWEIFAGIQGEGTNINKETKQKISW